MNRPYQELKTVKAWAQSRINKGEEPPWSWYKFMQLIEALEYFEKDGDTTMEVPDKYL